MPKGSVAVAVELPGEKWGKSDSLPYLESAVADLCADGYAASLVLGDSKALGVRQIAMARGPYDAIFIDGDHRLEGVSADWNNYSLLASPKGIVAFHDIDAHHQRKHMKIDVPHLWKRLKKQYRAVELIGTQRAMGIGIVWPGQPL
jgi:predicted O-methyltransferase YrrM